MGSVSPVTQVEPGEPRSDARTARRTTRRPQRSLRRRPGQRIKRGDLTGIPRPPLSPSGNRPEKTPKRQSRHLCRFKPANLSLRSSVGRSTQGPMDRPSFLLFVRAVLPEREPRKPVWAGSRGWWSGSQKTSCSPRLHCAEWSCVVLSDSPRHHNGSGRDWPDKSHRSDECDRHGKPCKGRNLHENVYHRCREQHQRVRHPGRSRRDDRHPV